MNQQLTDIIEDTLELRYGVGPVDRVRILNFLQRERLDRKAKRIHYADSFIAGSTLVAFSDGLDVDVRRLLYWNLSSRKSYAVQLLPKTQRKTSDYWAITG